MNNLNQDLYKRFGLAVDASQIRDGFQKYMKNTLLDKLSPIVRPDSYEQKNELWKIQGEVLSEICRQLYLDESDYSGSVYSGTWFFEKEFYDEFKGSFEEYLLRLQILLNILFQHEFIHAEVFELARALQNYVNDFPMLGITIKIYKTKAPQILPTTSKKFEEEIKNTLGLLETDKKYEHVLSHFENGLKEFLTAKTQAHYKDVIEDMYTACDELVKSISGKQGKGFKHISDKDDAKALKLNGHQKELFKNLRNWMDEIKHGSLKDFDRNDVEMIISMVGSLIRSTILKQ